MAMFFKKARKKLAISKPQPKEELQPTSTNPLVSTLQKRTEELPRFLQAKLGLAISKINVEAEENQNTVYLKVDFEVPNGLLKNTWKQANLEIKLDHDSKKRVLVGNIRTNHRNFDGGFYGEYLCDEEGKNLVLEIPEDEKENLKLEGE